MLTGVNPITIILEAFFFIEILENMSFSQIHSITATDTCFGHNTYFNRNLIDSIHNK